jgi:16S rRNA (guanine527-N7)-methyltransferase
MTTLQQWKNSGVLTDSARPKLELFIDLILQWNSKINLTGYRTREEIEELLIGESIAALKEMPAGAKEVLDFGSGAGIPGLIWAMCDPQIHTTSLEIRQKKVAFQKEVVRATSLSAQVLLGRFPDAVRGRKFDLIATRAVRFSPSLWKEAETLLRPSGTLLRFARRNASEEPGWRIVPISARSSLLLR